MLMFLRPGLGSLSCFNHDLLRSICCFTNSVDFCRPGQLLREQGSDVAAVVVLNPPCPNASTLLFGDYTKNCAPLDTPCKRWLGTL